MNKYVIWGAGARGKAVLEFLGADKVLAFIDSDTEKQSTGVGNIDIISYENYKQLYSGFFIIISMSKYKPCVELLEKDENYRYFIFSDCPQETYGKGREDLLNNLPFAPDFSLPNVFLGFTLFGICMADNLINSGESVYLVPDPNMDLRRRSEFKRAYPGIYKDDLFSINCEANIYCACDEGLETQNTQWHVYNIKDFGYQCEEYHNLRIEALPTHRTRERCFIVATGPSLRMEDLDKLHANHETCISMNKIFYSFDKTDWRPEYYLIVDDLVIGQNFDAINSLDLDNILVTDNYCGEFNPRVIRFHEGFSDILNGITYFSTDASRVMYNCGTITYICLQFAVYMGFKEIYLLGVDANFGQIGTRGNHFYEQEDALNYHWAKEESLLAYKKAKDYADKLGIPIMNATRGGMLEIFPRVDFDSLF